MKKGVTTFRNKQAILDANGLSWKHTVKCGMDTSYKYIKYLN